MPPLVGYAIKKMRTQLGQNLLSLYAIQGASYILPTLVLAFLARVIGPSAWGLVAFSQAFGLFLGQFVEFGFDLSAARKGAQIRDDKAALGELLTGVLGARAIVSCIVLVIAVFIQQTIPTFRDSPAVFWSGIFFAISFHFNLIWFFRAVENVKPCAVLVVLGKVVGTATVFALVREPDDAWIVLTALGCGNIFAAIGSFILALPYVTFERPRLPLIWRVVKNAKSLFIYRGVASLHESGNPFLLGLFVAPEIVAFFAGPERLSKSLFRLFNPVIDALFPRIANLAGSGSSRHHAALLTRYSLAFTASASILLAAVIYFASPLIIRILLGQEFAPAVGAMRILSILIPLMTVNQVLGIQWMIPLGMEKLFTYATLGAVIIDIVGAITFAPKFGHIGMAWTVITAEVFILVFSYTSLLWKRADPLTSFRGATSR